MSHARAPADPTQILVALDNSPDGLAALEAAVEWALAMPGELRGLFIEDDNLLRAAGLPFTHEVELHSAQRGPLTVDGLQRRLTSMAAQLRQALADAARRAQVNWSFTVARGPVCRVTLEQGRDADLIIIGRHSLAPRVRTTRPPRPHSSPVLALVDESPAASHVLQRATALAQQRHATLEIYLAVSSRSAVAPLQTVIVSEMTRCGWAGHVFPTPVTTPDELLAVARRRRPQLILLPTHSPLLDEALLETLVAQQDCPVALCR
ncbi:MAG: universal stress protein [Pirellulales bacterium]